MKLQEKTEIINMKCVKSARWYVSVGRTEPNLDDLGLAFQELQVSLDELKDYVHYVDAVPFALDIVCFPAPKSSHLTVDTDDKEQAAAGTSALDGYLASKAELEGLSSSSSGF